jgi:hypothetical protein
MVRGTHRDGRPKETGRKQTTNGRVGARVLAGPGQENSPTVSALPGGRVEQSPSAVVTDWLAGWSGPSDACGRSPDSTVPGVRRKAPKARGFPPKQPSRTNPGPHHPSPIHPHHNHTRRTHHQQRPGNPTPKPAHGGIQARGSPDICGPINLSVRTAAGQRPRTRSRPREPGRPGWAGHRGCARAGWASWGAGRPGWAGRRRRAGAVRWDEVRWACRVGWAPLWWGGRHPWGGWVPWGGHRGVGWASWGGEDPRWKVSPTTNPTHLPAAVDARHPTREPDQPADSGPS